jgi:hypothetical protein
MSLPSLTASAYDFAAEASVRPDGLYVKLVGTADMSVRPILDEFIGKLHRAAQDQHATQVVMDFRDLAFMNSSCLKRLVAWISEIQDLPSDERYRVVLISSPEMHWQRRSFHALSCLGGDLITVQS